MNAPQGPQPSGVIHHLKLTHGDDFAVHFDAGPSQEELDAGVPHTADYWKQQFLAVKPEYERRLGLVFAKLNRSLITKHNPEPSGSPIMATRMLIRDLRVLSAKLGNALGELVQTKDQQERTGKTPAYEKRRDEAWVDARKVLDNLRESMMDLGLDESDHDVRPGLGIPVAYEGACYPPEPATIRVDGVMERAVLCDLCFGTGKMDKDIGNTTCKVPCDQCASHGRIPVSKLVFFQNEAKTEVACRIMRMGFNRSPNGKQCVACMGHLRDLNSRENKRCPYCKGIGALWVEQPDPPAWRDPDRGLPAGFTRGVLDTVAASAGGLSDTTILPGDTTYSPTMPS